MVDTIAQMSPREFQQLLEATIEKKLLDLLGDPDEGLEIRKKIKDRLLRQQTVVKYGEHGKQFKTVIKQLQSE